MATTQTGSGETDVGQLRKLYKQSQAARALLDEFAGRKNSLTTTSVDRLVRIFKDRDEPLARGDVIDVFKSLEEIGSGKFRIGRRGKRSRFEWRDDMISVGQAASGEQERIDARPPDAPEEEPDDGLVSRPYLLRSDMTVTLDLPVDLTEREARRLADFVLTLPLGVSGERADR